MSWEEIANSDNPAAGLEACLESFLAETDADREVLAGLMRQFQSIEIQGDAACLSFVYVEFDDEVCEVVISKEVGESIAIESLAIESLDKIVKEHGGISAESLGGGELAFPANNMVDDFLANEDDFPEAPEIVFDVAQDIMIAHPTEKNARAEPKLYFIDHENGQAVELKGANELTAAQVFLRLLAQMIGCGDYFEQVSF